MNQTFPIVGMHCSGCAQNLTKALNKLPGVNSAKVTYTTNKAIIDYHEAKIDWQQVKKVVASVGSYQIVLPESTSATTLEAKNLKVLKTKTALSAVLTLIIFFGTLFKFLSHEIIFVLTSLVMFPSCWHSTKNATSEHKRSQRGAPRNNAM